MLQTRNAKRTGLAGVRWAVEMATGKDFYTGESQPKILSQKEALMTLSGDDIPHKTLLICSDNRMYIALLVVKDKASLKRSSSSKVLGPFFIFIVHFSF